MKTVLIVLTALSLTSCATMLEAMRMVGDGMRDGARKDIQRMDSERSERTVECHWCHGNGWVECKYGEYGSINGLKKCSWCKGTGTLKQ